MIFRDILGEQTRKVAMTIRNSHRSRFMAAVVALSVAIPIVGIAADWRHPRDELINRPAGPFACLPSEPACELRM
jgi:hypothetical protein